MGIEWKMICQQTDFMLQQPSQSSMLDTRDTGILSLPEITVVYQQGVRISFYCGLNQHATGCHTADQTFNPITPLNLKPVRAIVLEATDIEKIIRIGNKLFQFDHKKHLRTLMRKGYNPDIS
jgi:hypothetical protein